MKVLAILKYAATLAGIAMLVGTFQIYKSTSSFVAEATRAEGTVIDLVRSRSSSSWGNTYAPTVQFISQNGQTIEFVSSTGTNPPSYSKGQKVEVLYRPTEPQNAEINGFFSLWGSAILVGGTGGVLFLVGSGIILAGLLKGRKSALLRKNGTPIETEFLSVEHDTAWSVNGKHPFTVLTQWRDPSTSELHVFKSHNLWFDPSSHLKSRKVTVFIAKGNPREYVVDLSFLSERAE